MTTDHTCRVAAAPCAPAAPPPAPKAPSRKRKTRRRKSPYETFLQGETRAEMIRKFERQGVTLSPEDLAMKVPALRKLAKERLAVLQARSSHDIA